MRLFKQFHDNFLGGNFGMGVFRRIATGKRFPISQKLTGGFFHFSFRRLFSKLKEIFRRKPKKHADEITLRFHREIVVKATSDPEPATDNFSNNRIELPAPQPVPESWPASPEPASLPPPTPAALPSPAPEENTSTHALPQLEFTPAPEILRQFVNHARADFVLLSDRNGVPLAYSKSLALPPPSQNDLEMMAKLAAGQMAAARVIAHSINDLEKINSIFQEGERRNLFIGQISQDFNLVTVVDRAVVIGLVSIRLNEAVIELRKILES
jgi:predicted regulator of Ras-like GTPase activity (Roadblock/LC7/MglB family)